MPQHEAVGEIFTCSSSCRRWTRSGASTVSTLRAAAREVQDLKLSSTVMALHMACALTGATSCNEDDIQTSIREMTIMSYFLINMKTTTICIMRLHCEQ